MKQKLVVLAVLGLLIMSVGNKVFAGETNVSAGAVIPLGGHQSKGFGLGASHDFGTVLGIPNYTAELQFAGGMNQGASVEGECGILSAKLNMYNLYAGIIGQTLTKGKGSLIWTVGPSYNHTRATLSYTEYDSDETHSISEGTGKISFGAALTGRYKVWKDVSAIGSLRYTGNSNTNLAYIGLNAKI